MHRPNALCWFGLLLAVGACSCGGPGRETDAGVSPDSGAVSDSGRADDAGATAFSCAVLRDSSQCWNRLARGLRDCIPSGMGTLDAARTECAYPDGSAVRFAAAVPTSGGYEPRFTLVRPDGSECGAFDSGGFTIGVITSGDEAASLLQESGPRLRLTCNAGGVETTAFDAPYSDLSACVDAPEPLVPPGYNALIGPTFVRIQIISDGDNASPTLIDCAGS